MMTVNSAGLVTKTAMLLAEATTGMHLLRSPNLCPSRFVDSTEERMQAKSIKDLTEQASLAHSTLDRYRVRKCSINLNRSSGVSIQGVYPL